MPLMVGFLVVPLTACSAEQPEPGSDAQETSADGDDLTEGLQAHVEGRVDAAVASYEAVLATDPDDIFAHYNLGLIAQVEGQDDIAEDRYRRVLDIDPDYEPALFNLAILRSAADDEEEAVALYRHLIDIHADHAGAHLNLGFSLRALGEADQAQEAFERAAELDPALGERVPEGADEEVR